MKIEIMQGDITQFKGDAIVNAANVTLLGGGGVDGCIHRAAGPELAESCRDIYPEVEPGIRCPTGEARVTPGFRLPTPFVIHTVGPIFSDSPTARNPYHPGELADEYTDPELVLAMSIASCLAIAEKLNLRTLAMPAISCGVFGCTIKKFVEVSKTIVASEDWKLNTLTFMLFQDEEFEEFKQCWEDIG